MSTYTSSSLTLRALLKTAAGRLGVGAPAARVTGLTPAAQAMYAAATASRGLDHLVAVHGVAATDVLRRTSLERLFRVGFTLDPGAVRPAPAPDDASDAEPE